MLFFERPETGEKCLLVHILLPEPDKMEDLAEFKALAKSANAHVVGVLSGSRPRPHPKWFIGSGKLDELKSLTEELCSEVVLFNHALSPAQERNLERELKCRVLDRIGLILDIFAQRARTFEGKLQVELAQLQHLSSRLVRGWTHLERQKGGIGLRGPGETQLESDRRMVGTRIKTLKARIAKVRGQRQQSRRSRNKAQVPTFSLVGYTNAGKSSLFNRLCHAEVYAQDQLFATLDPTLRKIQLPGVGASILADTVGFIRHLPHKLIEAFHATLEEVVLCDVMLLVVDGSDPEFENQVVEVKSVLQSINALNVPCLFVLNKSDAVDDEQRSLVNIVFREVPSVWCSALTGDGMDALKTAAVAMLDDERLELRLSVPLQFGKLRSRLYQDNAILDESINEEGVWSLKVVIMQQRWRKLLSDTGCHAVLQAMDNTSAPQVWRILETS